MRIHTARSGISPSIPSNFSTAIEKTKFEVPICAVYQNITAKAERIPAHIKENLIAQLTGPVRWTQSVQNMIADGATQFIEVGPGKVLQGLVKKIDGSVEATSV